MEMITPEIVVMHCSDTPDYAPTDPLFDKFSLKDIELWHKQRGFLKCGYHLVIRRTGKIEKGRVIDIKQKKVEKGAHCQEVNSRSIGVCYIGRSQPTNEQIKAMASIYKSIYKNFGIDERYWFPHNLYNNRKRCPGFPSEKLYEYITKGSNIIT